MKKLGFVLLLGFVVCYLGFSLVGCANLSNFSFSSRANTALTSNSLIAASALRAQGITIAGTAESGNWLITPSRISGKIMSVVLPIATEEDDGLTPFGHGRPDIAPADSVLYDFDLSEVTTLTKESVSLKDSSVGGQCNQIILMFGYFDVEFDQDGTSKKLRFCYGDADPYVRGDKLLYNPSGEATGSFYWYSSTEGFVIETSSRPADACVNAYVRDFSDPIRPVMHYYMLGANLRDNTDYDGVEKDYITIDPTVVEENNLSFTVDFDVLNAVIFTGVSSEADYGALSDAELIEKFDMKQNTSGWGETELYCSITFEVTPK